MKIDNYEFIEITEIPVKIKPGIIYIDRPGYGAYFLCPCGCGVEIKLLIVDDRGKSHPPRWTIKENSISPSVNRLVGCKSHFFITNGKTIWT